MEPKTIVMLTPPHWLAGQIGVIVLVGSSGTLCDVFLVDRLSSHWVTADQMVPYYGPLSPQQAERRGLRWLYNSGNRIPPETQ